MKVNGYYVHSLQFGRWSMVLFRYYLLGGNTVAPSKLLARLCHAFLVEYLVQLIDTLSHNIISHKRVTDEPVTKAVSKYRIQSLSSLTEQVVLRQ